ncbi:MAG TPA: DASS family sodium-coupled anion symporter [Burkholderiaceae bacterium]|nr:DASS family sodium-coupled anion symporter [Burkholderiaceae bacterium]
MIASVSSVPRWIVPLALWLLLRLLPVPSGLSPDAWRYFAVFAAAIAALMVTDWPGGAIGLVAVSFIAAMRYVHHDPTRSITWALGGFGDTTVWLTFGAFLFALGYRKSGLGRRIALLLVRALGRRTIGLGYAIALSDLALAPGTPSNTARSGGTIFPIVAQIPPLYGSEPGPTASKIGTYLMWTAFAATAVTSSMFITALVPNAAALGLAAQALGLQMSWSRFFVGFAPAGVLLLVVVPLLAYWLCAPSVRESGATVDWAGAQLREMGPVSRAEWTMAALVLAAIALWVTGSNPRVSLPLVGSNFIHPTGVVLLTAAAMLVLRVISWDDLTGEREAWAVFLYFTMVLTLADGLNRTGFIDWFAQRAAAPLQGVDPLLATAALLALFFWSHYLFASITSHALAVLPVVLGLSKAMPGVDAPLLAMLCIYSLGLMGVLSPYATGCAPIYAGSGYIGRVRFWLLGAVFGVVYFGALLAVTWPWLRAAPIIR